MSSANLLFFFKKVLWYLDLDPQELDLEDAKVMQFFGDQNFLS